MKFGIFYEHQLPRPWTERSEHKLLQDSLEQIELPEIDTKGFTFRGRAKPTITPDGLRSDPSTAQN
jgi:hypothetical protein